MTGFGGDGGGKKYRVEDVNGGCVGNGGYVGAARAVSCRERSPGKRKHAGYTEMSMLQRVGDGEAQEEVGSRGANE